MERSQSPPRNYRPPTIKVQFVEKHNGSDDSDDRDESDSSLQLPQQARRHRLPRSTSVGREVSLRHNPDRGPIRAAPNAGWSWDESDHVAASGSDVHGRNHSRHSSKAPSMLAGGQISVPYRCPFHASAPPQPSQHPYGLDAVPPYDPYGGSSGHGSMGAYNATSQANPFAPMASANQSHDGRPIRYRAPPHRQGLHAVLNEPPVPRPFIDQVPQYYSGGYGVDDSPSEHEVDEADDQMRRIAELEDQNRALEAERREERRRRKREEKRRERAEQLREEEKARRRESMKSDDMAEIRSRLDLLENVELASTHRTNSTRPTAGSRSDRRVYDNRRANSLYPDSYWPSQERRLDDMERFVRLFDPRQPFPYPSHMFYETPMTRPRLLEDRPSPDTEMLMRKFEEMSDMLSMRLRPDDELSGRTIISGRGHGRTLDRPHEAESHPRRPPRRLSRPSSRRSKTEDSLGAPGSVGSSVEHESYGRPLETMTRNPTKRTNRKSRHGQQRSTTREYEGRLHQTSPVSEQDTPASDSESEAPRRHVRRHKQPVESHQSDSSSSDLSAVEEASHPGGIKNKNRRVNVAKAEKGITTGRRKMGTRQRTRPRLERTESESASSSSNESEESEYVKRERRGYTHTPDKRYSQVKISRGAMPQVPTPPPNGVNPPWAALRSFGEGHTAGAGVPKRAMKRHT
ncbi:hypothetical protein F4780DRAFT_4200 [Xylariomycetidae sp. FL0641]|nr:hypothetical protein F4780DRAFT_4200 [Xylariomycetidae sp. FL0641]